MKSRTCKAPLVLALAQCVTAQEWALVEEAPASIEHVYYDAARASVRAFSTYPDLQWTFDGTDWHRIMPADLPGHQALLACYDELRGDAVLVTYSYQSFRTYVSRGLGWQQMPSSPPAVHNASCVFDGASGRVLVFGGISSPSWQVTDDTYAWNGSAWTQLQPTSRPSPREEAGIAYDPIRNRVVLFGGRDDLGTAFGDTWEWDGMNWLQRSPAAAPPPCKGALAYDPATHQVVQLGGDSVGGTQALSWGWDGVTWIPRGQMPGIGVGQGWNDGVDLYFVESIGSHVWRSTAGGWMPVFTRTGPGLYDAAPVVVDPVRNEPLLVGGSTPGTWTWNGRWQQVATAGPGARTGAAMASYLSGVVLFGGMLNPLGLVGDTWVWNGASWTQRQQATQPTPRQRHRMTGTGATVLLSGGIDSQGLCDDLWEYDPVQDTWAQRQSSNAPPPRADHAFCFDPVRQRAVLFGGSDGNFTLNDTWEWDGSMWLQQVPVTSPSNGAGALVFDSSRGVMTLVQFDGTWDWTGTAWLPSGGAFNYDISGAYCTYDPVRQRVLCRGGWDDHTWILGPTPGVARQLGNGCGQPSDLRLLGRPAIGSAPNIHLEATPNTVAGFVYGLGPQSTFWTLECEQQVTFDALSLAAVGAAGNANQPFVLPNALAFRGLDLFVQAAVLDGGSALGASLSRALRMTIGD
jgi:hypothetical protein